MCVCGCGSMSSLRICRMSCSRIRRGRWRLICRCIVSLMPLVVAVVVVAGSYCLHAKYYFVVAAVVEAVAVEVEVAEEPLEELVSVPVLTVVAIHVVFEYYYSP